MIAEIGTETCIFTIGRKKKRLTEFQSRIVYWIKFQKWEQEKQEKTKEMMINSERSSLVGNEANIKISIYRCITND